MKQDRQKKYYEKIWDIKKLEKGTKKIAFQKETSDIEVVRFLDYVKKKKIKGSVLDVGCGGGRHSILFAEAGFDVTGFDFSSKAVSLAKGWAKRLGLDVKFKRGSVLDYKDSKKYDVVVDYGCLHHIKKGDWGKYKKTLMGATKLGAILFLFGFAEGTTYLKNVKLSPEQMKSRYAVIKGDYSWLFSVDEIRDLFEPEFEVVYCKGKKTLNRRTSFYTFYLEKLR